MGKRYFDLARTDLGAEASYSLDEGAGVASNDMRVVFSNGTNARHLDIYTEHPTGIDPGRMSEASLTVAGLIAGLVRINYEDTQGSDRIMAGIRSVRQELEARGRASNWMGSAQNADDIIALLRSAESAFGSRGRAEGHCAANS